MKTICEVQTRYWECGARGALWMKPDESSMDGHPLYDNFRFDCPEPLQHDLYDMRTIQDPGEEILCFTPGGPLR